MAKKKTAKKKVMSREETLELQVRMLKRDRVLLAKLAAKTPQFYNPADAWEAEALRDRILKESTR